VSVTISSGENLNREWSEGRLRLKIGSESVWAICLTSLLLNWWIPAMPRESTLVANIRGRLDRSGPSPRAEMWSVDDTRWGALGERIMVESKVSLLSNRDRTTLRIDVFRENGDLTFRHSLSALVFLYHMSQTFFPQCASDSLKAIRQPLKEEEKEKCVLLCITRRRRRPWTRRWKHELTCDLIVRPVVTWDMILSLYHHMWSDIRSWRHDIVRFCVLSGS
jgi:hypothetical protein